jgi:hypothetical protein
MDNAQNPSDFDLFTFPHVAGYKGDAETSANAAADITPHLGRLRKLALDAIGARGPLGFTAEELADALDLSRPSIQPRTSELYRLGQIAKSALRRPNASSGKMAVVWVLPCYVEQEREQVA